MTASIKKLALHRETLRTLDTAFLDEVYGGQAASSVGPKLTHLTGGIQGVAGNLNDTVYRPKSNDPKPQINDTVYRTGPAKIQPL
jgi:hypothetical protein